MTDSKHQCGAATVARSPEIVSDGGAIAVAAKFYLSRGWVPVRVGYREKMPDPLEEWPTLRPTVDEIATWVRCNVGLLLGPASGGLTDVDLDCPETVALAPFYLPPTWVFGRASKRRSHWLYNATGAKSHKFLDENDATIVEIRGETLEGYSGHQTVAPPSVHKDDEPIEWDPEIADAMEAPFTIDARELVSLVAKIYRGALFMRAGATVDEARAAVAAHTPVPRPKPKAKPALPKTAEVKKGAVCAVCGSVADDATRWRTPSVCSDRCVEEAARRHLRDMSPSISGSFGHRALWFAAIAMVRGFQLDTKTALDLLRDEFNPRCVPPWRPHELERKVRHAESRVQKTDKYPLGYLLQEVRP
jgi:hypothetical protein